MTTPNQPYPEWMQILGLGAFQIGGSNGSDSSFGQGISTDSINQLIAGPIGALATTSSGIGDGTLGDWVDSIADGFKGFLLTLPLQGLQLFQYFLPGTTAADFKDVPTAVATIMEKFGLDTLLEIGADLDAFQNWLVETWNDFSAAVTAFWDFLLACSNAILHFTTWAKLISDLNDAWTTFVATIKSLEEDEWASFEQLLETIFGIDPTSGMNNSWVTLFLQLENLVTLILEGDVSTSDWAAWWITTLEALGYSSASATSIGNWLSGNYATAINAKAWVSRLLTDLTIICDFLHVVYQAGAATDSITHLGTNGKRTWWSAINDILALFGIANGGTAPSLSGSTPGQAVSSASTNATSALTQIENALLGLINNLTGQALTSTTQTQVNGATATIAATTASNSSILSAVQSAAAQAGSGGTKYTFNPPNSGSITGQSQFTLSTTGSGNISFSGHVATSGTLTTGSIQTAVYNVASTITDYQMINAVFLASGSGGQNYLVGRSNTAGTTCVIAVVGPAAVGIYNVTGGTVTQIGSSVSMSPQMGAEYSFQCGAPGALREYQLLINGNPVLTVTDSSSITTVGSSNRHAGFSMNVANVGGIGLVPNTMSYWGFNDNSPSAIVGSLLRVANNSASTINVSSGDNKFPASTYTDVLDQSTDITYVASTNTATVSIPNVYAVKVSIAGSSGLTSQLWGTALYVNGTLYQQGDTRLISSATVENVISDIYFVPCADGTTIEPGYYSGATLTGAYAGETTATRMTFEIMAYPPFTLS